MTALIQRLFPIRRSIRATGRRTGHDRPLSRYLTYCLPRA
jgi:hypothetical protein